MATPEALLDSNVIVAMVAEEHEHHVASAALFLDPAPRSFAVAAHSFAEAYSTLTRRSVGAPFRRPAKDALAALESVASATALVGLSPAQTIEAIGLYARAGGIGARLYDHLIGRVAIQYGIARIISWNVRHMRDLFPGLDVVDPIAAARA